jgi:hypothetical protein
MTPRSRVLLGAAALAAVAAAIAGGAWWRACSTGGPAAGAIAGAALARGLAAAEQAAPELWLPRRCADVAVAADGERSVGNVRLRQRGGALELGDAAISLIGVVADARDDGEATRESLTWAHDEFRRAGVDLVISLGGMGEDRAQIHAALAALSDERWLLVALPGDRESTAEHAAAVQALAAEGWQVVDGTGLSALVFERGAVGLLPGAPSGRDGRAARLAAGIDGCVWEDADAVALGQALAERPGAHVIAAHAPPRQRGLAATDVSLSGVHVGQPALADAALRAAALVVHGWVDETGGRVAQHDGWRAAAVGPLEGLPTPRHGGGMARGAALIVELDARGGARARALAR